MQRKNIKKRLTLVDIISINDIRNLIYAKLDLQSAGRLHSIMALSKKSGNYMFHSRKSSAYQSLCVVAARKLMFCMAIADWDRAEVLVKKNPGLMFMKIPVMLDDGQIHTISSLQYTLYISDYHGLVMFQRYIYIEGEVDLVRQYQRQEKDQRYRLNITEFLCAKYETYIAKYEMWKLKKSGITDEELRECWDNIGLAQHILAWALREICANQTHKVFFDTRYAIKHAWSKHSLFQDPRPKGEATATICNTSKKITVLSYQSTKAIYPTCFRIDGSTGATIYAPSSWKSYTFNHAKDHAIDDLQCFKNLLKRRLEMINKISLASDISVENFIGERRRSVMSICQHM